MSLLFSNFIEAHITASLVSSSRSVSSSGLFSNCINFPLKADFQTLSQTLEECI